MATKASDAAPLVLSPKQLADLLAGANQAAERPRILDATWFMPNVKRDARKEFEIGPRIPGAVFWDVDQVATGKEDVDAEGNSLNPLGLSHMMPTSDKFAKTAGM